MFKKIILTIGLIACITERSVAQETVSTAPLSAAQYAAALFPDQPTARRAPQLAETRIQTRGIQLNDGLGRPRGIQLMDEPAAAVAPKPVYDAAPVAAAPIPVAAPAAPAAAERKSIARPVNFAYNSSVIPTDFAIELLQLVEAMKSPAAAGKVLVITGHTDARGSADYNLNLSFRRAQAVETFLIAHGVAREQLISTGKGMLQPLPGRDANDSLNRRVEFSVP